MTRTPLGSAPAGPADKSPTWLDLLERSVNGAFRRAGRDVLQALAARLEAESGTRAPPSNPVRALTRVLVDQEGRYREVARENKGVLLVLARVSDPGDREAALTRALNRLSEGRRLAEDLAALDRDLDMDAIADRCALRAHAARQPIEALLRVLAGLGGHDETTAVAAASIALAFLGDVEEPWSIRAAACHVLAAVALGESASPVLRGAAGGGPGIRQVLLEQALAMHDDPWVQAAGLEAWASLQSDLSVLDGVLGLVLDPRSTSPRHPDHMLARARAVALAGRLERWEVVRQVVTRPEPSEHVRVEAIRALARSTRDRDQDLLASRVGPVGGDVSPLVRTAGILALLPDRAPPSGAWILWETVVEGLQPGQAPVVVEVVLDALLDRFARGILGAEHGRDLLAVADEALAAWSTPGEPRDLRRAAALLRLRLHNLVDPDRRAAQEVVDRWAGSAREGDRIHITDGPVARLSAAALLDVLVVAAWNGLDLSASPRKGRLDLESGAAPPEGGYVLFCGSPPRPLAWRVLHALTHPDPAGRQGRSPLRGPLPGGRLWAPSDRLAQDTPSWDPDTRESPPDRLGTSEELPPAGALVAAARWGSMAIRTPHEVQELSVARRGWAPRLALVATLPGLARIRKDLLHLSVAEAREAWDHALGRSGFRVQRTPPPGSGAALGTALGLEQVLALLRSGDTNDGVHVALLALLGGAFLAGRRAWRAMELRAWRRRIPLVVGGGGLGAALGERLKAALFQGLGFTVLSRCGGAHPSLLVGIPGREPREILLPHPPDGTAWAGELLELAARRQVQVLQWECTSTRPAEARVLQKDWMRDDLTTLTQVGSQAGEGRGPTAREEVDTLAALLPGPGGQALTCDERMAPLLAERARGRLARVRREDRLIPSDLLARYACPVDPGVLALVVALAGRLGVEPDVALRSMSDHLAPPEGAPRDLGPVSYEGRTVHFRGGLTSSGALPARAWNPLVPQDVGRGLGLDERLVLVVSPPATGTRGAPGRVGDLARFALDQARADAVVVLDRGEPFLGAWREGLPPLRARLSALEPDDLVGALSELLRRSPLARDRVLTRLQAARPDQAATWEPLVERLWSDDRTPDAVSLDLAGAPVSPPRDGPADLERWLEEVSWLHLLQSHVGWSVEKAIAAGLALLEGRISVASSPQATSDGLFHRVAMAAPPGATVRVLAIGALAGPGLELLRRWRAVQQALDWRSRLEKASPAQALLLLPEAATWPDPGVADLGVAWEALQSMGQHPFHQGVGGWEGALRGTLARLAPLQAEARRCLERPDPSFWARDLTALWDDSFDLLDAMSRRRAGQRLLSDLAEGFVGRDRAAQVALDLDRRSNQG